MKITNNDELKFIKIESDTNKYITKYREGDDIESFYATTITYCPKDFDTSIFREIDKAEYDKYVAEQKEYFERKESENLKKMI
jgi:hypothetical protein